MYQCSAIFVDEEKRVYVYTQAGHGGDITSVPLSMKFRIGLADLLRLRYFGIHTLIAFQILSNEIKCIHFFI